MSDDHQPETMWPQELRAFDVLLPTAAENLSFDEALLAWVDRDPANACLRVWEPQNYFVVLGRSNKAENEVNLEQCDQLGIPVFRRASGGGTVLVGPGCLCYSLLLPLTADHRRIGVSEVAKHVMGRTAAGLRPLLSDVTVCGVSDLVTGGRKFSGNAQRWLKQALIHHGTILFNFDLDKLARCLARPSRQPAYREDRSHRDFVTNVPRTADEIGAALKSVWNAKLDECPAFLFDETREICQTRYSSDDWQRPV